MTKTSRILMTVAMVAAAAVAVSACKWGGKTKDPAPVPASGAVTDTAPAAADASATPPASGAVAPDSATSAAPAKKG